MIYYRHIGWLILAYHNTSVSAYTVISNCSNSKLLFNTSVH